MPLCRGGFGTATPLRVAEQKQGEDAAECQARRAKSCRFEQLGRDASYSVGRTVLPGSLCPDRSEPKRCKYEPRETNKTKMQGAIRNAFYFLYVPGKRDAVRTTEFTPPCGATSARASICRRVPPCRCLPGGYRWLGYGRDGHVRHPSRPLLASGRVLGLSSYSFRSYYLSCFLDLGCVSAPNIFGIRQTHGQAMITRYAKKFSGRVLTLCLILMRSVSR